MQRYVLWVLILLAAATASRAEAQGAGTPAAAPCQVPQIRTDIRPDPDGPPTTVLAGVRAIDVREINDVDQTLTVDIAIRLIWTDHRLDNLEGCRLPIRAIWWPDLILLNSGRRFIRWPQQVSVGADGKVTYLQRISGTFASYHNLRDFPFDRQAISLRFLPLVNNPDQVTVILDDVFTGIGDTLNISDWIIESTTATVVNQDVPALADSRSRLDFTIHAKRIRSFYVWKLILPLSLIVFMSWCVFWIDPVQFGSQIGLSATSMLTMIAFIFATTNILPALGYFTRLDVFIAGTTVLVFLALLVTLVTSYLVSIERGDQAKKLDRACRALFPASFAIFATAIFLPVLLR